MSRTGEYRHNPFMLDDQNRSKDPKPYDISRGVSTTELGRSDTVLPPLKVQSLLHPAAALSNISLQPALELDTEKKTKLYTGLGMIERGREKSLRPVHQQQRVSSWSDARSAWNDEGFWMSGKGKMRPRLGKVNTASSETREENGVDDGPEEGKEMVKGRNERSDQDSSKSARMLGGRRYVATACQYLDQYLSWVVGGVIMILIPYARFKC